jgi:hypothetical protein
MTAAKYMRAMVMVGAVVVIIGVEGGPSGAAVEHLQTKPLHYSHAIGRIPRSERVRRTLQILSRTTVRTPGRDATVRISQSAALEAAPGPIGQQAVNGKTVYPTVLFGIMTDSVMRHICTLPPGLASPPTTTSSTACNPGLIYRNVPVWVIGYKGVTAPVIGGAGAPGVTTTQPVTTTTINPNNVAMWTFVDARNGAYLFGES